MKITAAGANRLELFDNSFLETFSSSVIIVAAASDLTTPTFDPPTNVKKIEYFFCKKQYCRVMGQF